LLRLLEGHSAFKASPLFQISFSTYWSVWFAIKICDAKGFGKQKLLKVGQKYFT